MAQKSIVFDNSTEQFFSANPRQLAGYEASIQNNTTQTITITVTNQKLTSDDPLVYGVPSSGALTVVAGAIGQLDEAYQGWKITATSTSGTVDITEIG